MSTVIPAADLRLKYAYSAELETQNVLGQQNIIIAFDAKIR